MKETTAKTLIPVNVVPIPVEVIGQLLNPYPFLRYNYCSFVAKGAQKGVMEAGFKPDEIWYTGSGTQMKVRDPQDGQEYLLEVRPVYPKG